MWSSIENLKQNLNKIALDVREDDGEDEDDLVISDRRNGYDSPVSTSASTNRRNSHRFAHSNSASLSPLPNGTDSPINFEIEQYKAEIMRLKESESELKALLVNYAALMKKKEDQISILNQENGSLKQNLDSTREALNVSRNENSRASANIGNVHKEVLINHQDKNIDLQPKLKVVILEIIPRMVFLLNRMGC